MLYTLVSKWYNTFILMNEGKDMFTIVAKQDMIEKLQEAIKNELHDIAIIFPDLKEKVEEKMLWGIFSQEDMFVIPNEKYRHHEAFASLSYSVIEKAKQELKAQGEDKAEFFVPSVDKIFKEKNLELFLDFEDCDVKVEHVTSIKMNKDIQAVIAITLPDSSVVFESLVEGNMFDEKNRWLWEYMEVYDSWKYEIMNTLYNYLWQIGGHGRFIQNDYNDTYVAQANIKIGDGGSVFVEIRDTEINAYVDMH